MTQLLPCPFCGDEAEIERIGTPRQSTIYSCTNCGCRLETGEEFNHGADWNRRSQSDERDFEMMLRKLVYRFGSSKPVEDQIAQAEDLLRRKGIASALRMDVPIEEIKS